MSLEHPASSLGAPSTATNSGRLARPASETASPLSPQLLPASALVVATSTTKSTNRLANRTLSKRIRSLLGVNRLESSAQGLGLVLNLVFLICLLLTTSTSLQSSAQQLFLPPLLPGQLLPDLLLLGLPTFLLCPPRLLLDISLLSRVTPVTSRRPECLGLYTTTDRSS